MVHHYCDPCIIFFQMSHTHTDYYSVWIIHLPFLQSLENSTQFSSVNLRYHVLLACLLHFISSLSKEKLKSFNFLLKIRGVLLSAVRCLDIKKQHFIHISGSITVIFLIVVSINCKKKMDDLKVCQVFHSLENKTGNQTAGLKDRMYNWTSGGQQRNMIPLHTLIHSPLFLFSLSFTSFSL